MVARVFKLNVGEDVALQLLGAAVVLRWSTIPPVVQEGIVQQALAMSGASPSDLHDRLKRILPRFAGDGTIRPEV